MSASAMPLCSVTPWKVDRSHLYPWEKQGDIRGGTKKRRGPLSSESNSVVRRFLPSPPGLVLLSFFVESLHPSVLLAKIVDILKIWTTKSCEIQSLDDQPRVPTCLDLDLDFSNQML
jgi:hypothetical protein